MFDPAAIRDAQREAGLTRQVSVTIGGNTYAGVHVSWRQPDRSVFDDFSQQTDYRIKYWTEDLPGLKKGDSLVRGGVLYSIADTPSFDGPDGNWSSVRLARVSRDYPKQPGDASGSTVSQDNHYHMATAQHAIAAFRFLRSAGAGKVAYADNTRESDGPLLLGIALQSAASGADVTYQSAGSCINPAWSWAPDVSLFVGVDGNITDVAPDDVPGAMFSAYIGFAVSATEIVIDIEEPVYL